MKNKSNIDYSLLLSSVKERLNDKHNGPQISNEVSNALEALSKQEVDGSFLDFDAALKKMTISYLLGWSLIESVESKEGLVKLPKRLLKLLKENNYRKVRAEVKKELAQNSLASKLELSNVEKKQLKIKEKVQPVNKKEIVNKTFVKDFPLLNSSNGLIKNYLDCRVLVISDDDVLLGLNTFFRAFKLDINKGEKVFEQLDASSSNYLILASNYYSPSSWVKQSRKILEILEKAKQKNMIVLWYDNESNGIYKDCAVIYSKYIDHLFVVNYKLYEANFGEKTSKINKVINQVKYNPNNADCYPRESVLGIMSKRNNGFLNAKPIFNKTNGHIVSVGSEVDNLDGDYKINKSEIPYLLKRYKVYLNTDLTQNDESNELVGQAMMSGVPSFSMSNMEGTSHFESLKNIENEEYLYNHIKKLLSKKWIYRQESHLSYRSMMNDHSYLYLGKKIQSETVKENSHKKVSILSATMRPEYIDRLIESIKCQNYNEIEAIVVTQNFKPAQLRKLKSKLKTCTNLKKYLVIANNTKDSLGQRLNQAASYATGDYFAKFDDDDFYFENYLSDMLIPFSFGKFGIVGKLETFVYIEETEKTYQYFIDQGNRISEALIGGTLVIDAAAFKEVGGFSSITIGEDKDILEKMKLKKIPMYASDPFNYVIWRAKDLSRHTWQADSNNFINNACLVSDGLAVSIAVV